MLVWKCEKCGRVSEKRVEGSGIVCRYCVYATSVTEGTLFANTLHTIQLRLAAFSVVLSYATQDESGKITILLPSKLTIAEVGRRAVEMSDYIKNVAYRHARGVYMGKAKEYQRQLAKNPAALPLVDDKDKTKLGFKPARDVVSAIPNIEAGEYNWLIKVVDGDRRRLKV